MLFSALFSYVSRPQTPARGCENKAAAACAAQRSLASPPPDTHRAPRPLPARSPARHWRRARKVGGDWGASRVGCALGYPEGPPLLPPPPSPRGVTRAVPARVRVFSSGGAAGSPPPSCPGGSAGSSGRFPPRARSSRGNKILKKPRFQSQKKKTHPRAANPPVRGGKGPRGGGGGRRSSRGRVCPVKNR